MTASRSAPVRALRRCLDAQLRARREEIERRCGCGVWWLFWGDAVFVMRKALTLRRVGSFRLSPFPNCSPIFVMNAGVVHPDFRGRGVATLLHEIRLAAAKQAGVQCLLATVTTANAAQNRVMQRFGWTVDAVVHNPETGHSVQLYRYDFAPKSEAEGAR